MDKKLLEKIITDFDEYINNMSEEEFEQFCNDCGLVSKDNDSNNISRNK